MPNKKVAGKEQKVAEALLLSFLITRMCDGAQYSLDELTAAMRDSGVKWNKYGYQINMNGRIKNILNAYSFLLPNNKKGSRTGNNQVIFICVKWGQWTMPCSVAANKLLAEKIDSI